MILTELGSDMSLNQFIGAKFPYLSQQIRKLVLSETDSFDNNKMCSSNCSSPKIKIVFFIVSLAVEAQNIDKLEGGTLERVLSWYLFK